jgi:tRNA(Ile)-lysidine synthase
VAALAPPVAAVRTAVRSALAAVAAPEAGPEAGPGERQPLALVACSGGADSLALAAAAGFVAPRAGWRAGVLTVDHGLQDGSHERAAAVAAWARGAGLSPVEVLPVDLTSRPGGPEAAARDARYEALAGAATRRQAAAVLLGHTRDDQAETVLLALARGAGPRGLAGMPASRSRHGVTWLRPLLRLPRAQTRAACAALGLDAWEDPHNTDPAYARARVRMTALPALVDALGDRVVDNLARTAAQVADDNAALDQWASRALAKARGGDGTLAVAALRDLPDAVRTRVLHAWARELGTPGAALSHRHVAAMDALVTDWRGQGPTHLPGGRTVRRHAGRLLADGPGGGATAQCQV